MSAVTFRLVPVMAAADSESVQSALTQQGRIKKMTITGLFRVFISKLLENLGDYIFVTTHNAKAYRVPSCRLERRKHRQRHG